MPSPTTGADIYERGDIKSLYFGARVLVTGASGFLGKVLLESLLRKTEVDKIYILIRSKKNKTPEERLKEIINGTVFKNLKADNPERLSAIFPISGDISLPNLGLSQQDEEQLVQDVEIVFHGAATVNFTENLKLATEINVQGTKEILNLARKMRNLKVVMHVSTAYANCHLDEIDEKIYPCEVNIDLIKMAESLNHKTAHCITKEIIGDSPNTYVYTKRVAEDLIDKHYKDLPIGILRPGVVIGSLKEPVSGWVDNLYGPTGLVIGMMSGLVHCTVIKWNAKADVVPVDMVANCLISAAWDTYTRYITNEEKQRIPIYNMVSSVEAPATWGNVQEAGVRHAQRRAPSGAVWYSFSPATTSWTLFRLFTLFVHYLPAYLYDRVLAHTGKKEKWVRMYSKIDDLMEVLIPFCTRDWIFRNRNVSGLWKRMSSEEQDLFPFTFKGFDWPNYFNVYIKGVIQFMMKDSITEKASKEKTTRLFIYHCLLISVLIVIISSFIYLVLTSMVINTLN